MVLSVIYLLLLTLAFNWVIKTPNIDFRVFRNLNYGIFEICFGLTAVIVLIFCNKDQNVGNRLKVKSQLEMCIFVQELVFFIAIMLKMLELRSKVELANICGPLSQKGRISSFVFAHF